MLTEREKSEMLPLAETAALHGVSPSELREAVRDGRPVADMNVDRYAVEHNGEISFSFPSWYSFPADDEAEVPAPHDDRRGSTDGEEPEEKEEGKATGRKAAEAGLVLGGAILLGSLLSQD